MRQPVAAGNSAGVSLCWCLTQSCVLQVPLGAGISGIQRPSHKGVRGESAAPAQRPCVQALDRPPDLRML